MNLLLSLILVRIKHIYYLDILYYQATFFSTYHGKCKRCQMFLNTFPLLIGGIVDNIKLGIRWQLGDGEVDILLLLHVQVQERVRVRDVHPPSDVGQAQATPGPCLRVQTPHLHHRCQSV